MKRTGLVLVITLATGLAVGYQSCGDLNRSFRANVAQPSGETLTRSSGGGNGLGYDGKRNIITVRRRTYPLEFWPADESYFRLLPNYMCSTNGADEILSHAGAISFTAGTPRLTLNSCTSSSQPVSGIEVRSYSPDYLTQGTGVYEKLPEAVFKESYIVAHCQTPESKHAGTQVIVKRTHMGPDSVTGAALSVDFSTGTIPPGFSFEREDQGESFATYFDSGGVLRRASTGLPRFGYEPNLKEFRGILIEGTRTNSLVQSEDLTKNDAAEGTLVTPNLVQAPDDNLTADRLSEDNSQGQHSIGWTFENFTEDNRFSFSLFVKPDGRNQVSLRVTGINGGDSLSEGFLLNGRGSVNRSLQELPTLEKLSSDIQRLPDGWYRIWMSFEMLSETKVQLDLVLSKGGLKTYQGEPGAGVFVWGRQLEEYIYPSSYIPTEESPRTRQRDILKTRDLSWFSPGQAGAFFLDWDLPWVVKESGIRSGMNLYKLNALATGLDHYIRIFGRSWQNSPYQPAFQMGKDGKSRMTLSGLDWAGSGRRRNLISFTPEEGTGYENGYPAGVRAIRDLPTDFDELVLGGTHWDGHFAFGYIRKFYYWPHSLTDEQLVSVSSLPEQTIHASLVRGTLKGDGTGDRVEIQNFPILPRTSGDKILFGSSVFDFVLQMENQSEMVLEGQFKATIDEKPLELSMECRLNP
ncbi:MAG: hypothetical protein H6624_02615 [Bdellovibrionaceae bacterium]|nr:hypothetical protein [Bdellovibrionales bacterium]MCB9083204.1 hypothetical protein [Pseudobdellovibrionaceae bacterium]